MQGVLRGLSQRAQEFWAGYYAAKRGEIAMTYKSQAWRDGFAAFKQRPGGV